MSNLQFSPHHTRIILAVDTSQTQASFAISCGAKIIASLQGIDPIPHSKVFFNLLSVLLKDAGLELAEIDLFSAAIGPGSFTGLRVGLSAIKGLSHSLGKQAVGVSSLDATALTSSVSGKVLALIDAGREEVYAGLREVGPSKMLTPLGKDAIGNLSEVLKSFNQYVMEGPLTVVIQGNSLNGPLSEYLNHFLNFRLEPAPSFSAEEIAIYVDKNFNNNLGFGLHPYYIRPSDAEMKRVS